MALEHQVNEEAFNGMDKNVQEHYEKQGDDYYLQAVGMSPNSKVKEFRDNNVNLKKQAETDSETITDLTSKLETANKGVDKDQVKNLVEEGIGKRTAAMQEEHDTAMTTMTGRAEKAEGSLSGLVVNDAVSREAIGAGVKETALTDILTRAKGVFKVVDGKAVPYDGEDIVYGKDGKTPLSVPDWLAGQAIAAPHLFKESKGGDAHNKEKGGGATGKTITRKEFESKNAADRMEYTKAGGKVVD